MLFGQFRLVFEYVAMHQSCPVFIRNIIFGFIRFVSNLAPPVQQATTVN